MARKHEAATLLLLGFSPGTIGEIMGISTSTVTQYLYNQVGEGTIRRSDILFSVDNQIREKVEGTVRRSRTGSNRIKIRDKLGEDAAIYYELRDSLVLLTDAYDNLSRIEIALHNFVRDTFAKHYTSEEYGPDGWWTRGIPQDIRGECAKTREEDPDRAREPYCYTNFIHLEKIFNSQWNVLEPAFPQGLTASKRDFCHSLRRLNRIRNRVMHPCKGLVVDEKDFGFVKDFASDLGLVPWRIPIPDAYTRKINDCGSEEAFVHSLHDLLKQLRKKREDKWAPLRAQREKEWAELEAKQQSKGSSWKDKLVLARKHNELWEKTESELKSELDNIRKAFWPSGAHPQEL